MSKADSSSPSRPAERTARAVDEEPVSEETIWAHIRRRARCKASAAATALLDPCIGSLQRLRKLAGGAQEDADAEAGGDRLRSRTDSRGGRKDDPAPTAETEAPKPKRRLRAFLVYLSVLLAGGMGGAALSYDLLSALLDRQGVESRRLEAAASKQAKAAATARNKIKGLEKKLETTLAEHAKFAAEKQKKLAATEKRLGSTLAGVGASYAPRPSPGRKARSLKAGNCTLGSGNIDTLKDCIEDFNR